MMKRRSVSRWILVGIMLGGGALFQTTGCAEIAAGLTSSWMTAVSDSFISSWLNQRFRVSTFSFSTLNT